MPHDLILRFVDHNVGIMGFNTPEKQWTSSLELLERVSFTLAPPRVKLPSQNLKHLRVETIANNPLTVFLSFCAELVFNSSEGVSGCKGTAPPPHMRILCTEMGSGVTPPDFVVQFFSRDLFELTPDFDVGDLRVFNQYSCSEKPRRAAVRSWSAPSTTPS